MVLDTGGPNKCGSRSPTLLETDKRFSRKCKRDFCCKVKKIGVINTSILADVIFARQSRRYGTGMVWFSHKTFLTQQNVAAFFTTGTYVKIQLFLSWMKSFFYILFVIKDDVISFHRYLHHSFSHPHPLLWDHHSQPAGGYLPSEKMREHLFSVADLGCSSRIPDPNFSIPDPGSKRFPGSGSATKNLSILTQKIISKLSEI
jgi:hypothetical protein